MIDINAEIRSRSGSFSRERLLLFGAPNIYMATSIGDFIANKDKIEPTQHKLFLEDRRLAGKASIWFHNCEYRKIHQMLPGSRFNKSWYRSLDNLKSLEAQDLLSEQDRDVLDRMIGDFHNGAISDATGQLGICCPQKISSGTRFQDAFVVYNVKRGLLMLNGYCTYGPSIKQGDEDNLTLLDRIIGLVPEYA